MKVWKSAGKALALCVVVMAVAFGTNAYSAKPDNGCGPKPKVCPKLWAPVICDDGKVYSNDCWAQKRCATGCVPYGQGP